MALKIVTPPAEMPVTLQEAKDHLRVEVTTSDALIARQIRAVADWLAGRNGWLGRSIIRQTLALTLPLPILTGFTGSEIAREGASGITLPRPPVISVKSVEVVDATGAPVIVPSSGFTTYDGDDDLTHLVFLPDLRWPVIAAGPAFVRVTYDAGYGPNSTDVDEGLRHAILMAVARLHEARGDPFSTSLQDDPVMQRMFAPYRVWSRV
jgi:uncharacterized phiE125 gp8 family phage protein